MSNRHGSISDYPEHLNPFYEGNEKLRFWKFGKVKRSGSFGESLRNTLTFKSFRGKKKDKQEIPHSPPELRKQAPTITPRQRQTLPTTLSPIYSPRNTAGPALPRSRFSERVRKTNANLEEEEEVPNGHVPATAPKISAAANPFEDDGKLAELKAKRIRRRKKRAPPPPNMAREEGDTTYLGVSSMHNFSKWSLTSVETDISTYSDTEHLSLDAVNQEMSNIMNNITKEMEKMTDDTKTNNISETKEINDEKSHSSVPELIASSTEGIKRDEIHNSTEKASVCEDAEHENKEQPTDENSNVVPKVICEIVEEEIKDVTNCNANEATAEEVQKNSNVIEDSPSIEIEAKNVEECDENANTPSAEEVQNNNGDVSENTPSVKVEMKSVEIYDENENTPIAEKELRKSNCDASKDTPSAEEELKNANNCDESENAASKSECDTISNSSEKSRPEVLYNATYNHASVQDLNFNERKSIYITASNDQLDKSDSLTNIENTIEVTENVDINRNKNVSPPTSPRCKTQVSLILNNHAQEGAEEKEVENVDNKEEAVYHPIPKTRASKPSKSDLLGNEITGTD